ncbi:MAG: hypothetical protein ACI9UA_003406 [Pseudoalteromonas tetraodonis]|jgi:hypothetical protein
MQDPSTKGLTNNRRKLIAMAVLLLLAVAGVFGWQATRRADNAPDPQIETRPQPAAWPPPASLSSAIHVRMLDELAEIARSTPDENIWLGDKRARKLRAELADLPDDASHATLGKLKSDLAKAELKLGNESEAIRLLTECDQQHLRQLAAGWPREQTFALANTLRFDLGVAHLRLGETQNCCRRNTPDSCIMPIQGSGIHTNQVGSRNAIAYFSSVLKNSAENSPVHLRARWLLNIAYMTLGAHPDEVPGEHLIPLENLMSDDPFPRFTNIASKLGLDTYSLSGGAIADDFDNDGYLDLVVSTYDPTGQIRLFHNNRDGTFTDRTDDAGLTGILGGLNLVQADFDNDGWLDILVLRGAWLGGSGQHPNSLLRNDGVPGVAQFTDVTYSSGLADANSPTQTAAWADYDNDGDLDLYVGNETMPGGPKFPCQLFRNNGDRTFSDLAQSAGVTNDRFTKAVVWGDYDGDRYPDIYVSNFEGENRLYHNNNGDGTFTDLGRELGVTAPHESFPAWFWDYDNDGVLDIYASGYFGDIAALAADALGEPHESEQTCLYRGDGHGGFQNVAAVVGLTRPSAPMGSNFGDLDGDGYNDFYLGTGEPKFMNLMPNLMYLNKGGKQFVDITKASGFGHLQKGHAVTFADLDNDGDQDVFEQMGGGYPGDPYYDALFENPGHNNHWVTLKLIGKKSNRSAIGARIRIDLVEAGQQRSVFKWVSSGGSFGANPLRQNIGLGRASKIEQLEVYWPTSDTTQRWSEVPFDTVIKITEGKDQLEEMSLKRLSLGQHDGE